MQLPGLLSICFLILMLVVLPVAAYRSAGRWSSMRGSDGRLPGESREALLAGTLFVQALLLFIAWFVGRGFGFQPFAVSTVRLIDVMAAVLALALCLAMLPVSRWLRSEREQRELFVYQLAPRTRREWAWWVPTVLVAGVAEEVAYRGVTMTILWYALGNPWVAALICAVAFALAHATQGWKSGVIIFVIGLLMHGLVAFTGTLVLAMMVHVAYNLIAGGLIAREARRLDRIPPSVHGEGLR